MKRLYRNRAAEAAIQNALITRLGARVERPIRAEISRAMKEGAVQYERNGDVGIESMMAGHTERMEKILAPFWSTGISFFSSRVSEGIKGRRIQRKADYMTPIQIWMQMYARKKLAQITTTTRDSIREIITGGIAEGFGVDKVARLITDAVPSLSKLRAHVIARTEAHGAANFGSLEGAREVDPSLGKEWIAVADERTRNGEKSEFDHVSADGQIVGLHDMFDVSGESLAYPGDSAGSAGNVIMCRCVIGYVRL